jgi:tetratricopeptide (TPR) repeat protein
VKEGNYSLALEFADQLLKRYPNHVKTLQTRGSLLLKIGEKAEAVKSYQKAQDLEPDARVEELIRKLESEIGG